jgi:hypothetical protein
MSGHGVYTISMTVADSTIAHVAAATAASAAKTTRARCHHAMPAN